jgi:NADH-quinone oxidoreductase subunit F
VTAAETKPLTRNIDIARGPLALKAYEAVGGYASVRKSLKQLTPAEVTHCVKDANLRGRGGAGFPTGVKWSLVPMGPEAPKQKYVVCNADEMEPGTFKDRLLMEQDPHLMIESMITPVPATFSCAENTWSPNSA